MNGLKGSKFALAAFAAGGISAALLSGALVFQYGFGLPPCEMCIWQRWPHGIAIVIGLAGGLLALGEVVPVPLARIIAYAAILALAVSGAIGAFHAGVEWKWWPGPDACTGGIYIPPPAGEPVNFRFIRCDEAAWRFLGISLAGYNAIISIAGALAALSLLRKKAAS